MPVREMREMYTKIAKDFWKDDVGVIWETVDINNDNWSFVMQKVNYPEVRITVHGSRFES